MKKNDINRMISLIDDEKLFASEKAGKRRLRWTKVAAMAACAALILSSALILPRMLNRGHEDPSNQPHSQSLKIVSTSATSYHSPGLIANDTGFVIKTENGTKENVEKSVYLTPPVEYNIEEVEKDTFLLTPSDDLPDNTVISLAQMKDAKVTESWAYQTKNDLTVSGSYPRNEAMSVSVNSVIEIVLSYADVENFDEYVSFTPEISGKWEHLGKTWRFIPDKALEKDTTYTVGVRSGFKSANMTNTAAYSFTFSTFDDNGTYPYRLLNASVDGILTFRPGDKVKFAFDTINKEKQVQISRISLEKLNGADAFLQKLEDPGADVESTPLGDASFTWQNLSHDSNFFGTLEMDTVVLDDTLPEGYYIARIYNMANKERSTVFLQVNRISAYALKSLNEVLVWTAQDGELAEGLSVSYNGGTQTTDKNGIARFPVTEDEKMIYATIGENAPLVIGVPVFEGNYFDGYIYTDRGLYRENDLIQIWGYVPPKYIGDGDAKFTLCIGDYKIINDVKIEVVPDEFGCFTTSFKLSDYKATDNLYIDLYYNGDAVPIARRRVEVRNYSAQYYSYEILLDKNYVRIGDTLDFDVKVTHLSQASVPGKKVYACGQWSETDENGVAHFSVPAAYWRDEQAYLHGSNPFTMEMIKVQNGDGTEMNSYQVSERIYVFYSDTLLVTEQIGENQYTAEVYKLNFDSDVSVLEFRDTMYSSARQLADLIGTPVENTSIRVNLWESKNERYIESYRYNEYTKEQEPVYDIKNSKSMIREWTATVKDGSVTVDGNDFPFKTSDEEIWYSYYLELTAEEGLPEEIWFRSLNMFNGYEGYFERKSLCFIDKADEIYTGAMYKKFAYKFGFGEDRRYTFGETVDTVMNDINGSSVTDGNVLRVLIQQNIIDADVVSAGELSFAYPDGSTPNVYLVGAYFKDGVFHRILGGSVDHDPSESELKVTVSPDQEEYKFGEDVTLEIDVTDASGKGAIAEVSVSVVDEAALAVGENDVDITRTIFKSLNYPRYLYSSYQDYTLSRYVGGIGGGESREYRSNFAHTAYFGTVITDENGHARVTFKLPDTVTTYRVTAQAVDKKVQVGATKTALTVKQDFFIQHTEPRKVKATDDLVVGACAIGATDSVNFTFTLKETGKQIPLSTESSAMVYANFGKLALGTYTVRIDAQSGEYSDGVEYTVDIISTAQTVRKSKRTKVSDGETVEAATSPVVVEICNTGTARYREYLEYLRKTVNERLDTQIAGREAIILQNELFEENAYVPYIDYSDYYCVSDSNDITGSTQEYLLAPLKNAQADVILTALCDEYWNLPNNASLTVKDNNPFETALFMASRRQAILFDLEYLAKKAETDREKLLVSISYALLGDYDHARENYVQTSDFNSRSLQAMAATFIDRENAAALIDELISTVPEDMYLRFAVLSYLHRDTELTEREESVTVTAGAKSEKVIVKGAQIKRLVFNKEDVSEIKFTASTENIDVVYYYDTAVERMSGDDVLQDISVSLKQNGGAYPQKNQISAGSTLTLEIDLTRIKTHDMYGYITVALPNNLRMAQTTHNTFEAVTVVNKDDYLIIHLCDSSPQHIKIPLYAACEGEYTFESVVLHLDDQYHISEPFVYNTSPIK